MFTQVTDWYPADIKPVRIGYYEVKSPVAPDFILKLFWSGKRWQQGKYSAWPVAVQAREWRGIIWGL